MPASSAPYFPGHAPGTFYVGHFPGYNYLNLKHLLTLTLILTLAPTLMPK